MRQEMIALDRLGSVEYYETEQGHMRVLEDITFTAREEEIWAVTGETAYELRLLLDIVANARPYDTGRCTLCQIGMMRKKRVILPHVFHIGSTNMMLPNMNVLEYMMFLTSNRQGEAAVRQKMILDKLVEVGLGYVSLTYIKALTPQEKSVVLLFASLFMKETKLVIWNLPRLIYPDELLDAVANICDMLKKQKKTMLISTTDSALIQKAATHVLYLENGRVRYRAPVEELLKDYDVITVVTQTIEPTVGQALKNMKMKGNRQDDLS